MSESRHRISGIVHAVWLSLLATGGVLLVAVHVAAGVVSVVLAVVANVLRVGHCCDMLEATVSRRLATVWFAKEQIVRALVSKRRHGGCWEGKDGECVQKYVFRGDCSARTSQIKIPIASVQSTGAVCSQDLPEQAARDLTTVLWCGWMASNGLWEDEGGCRVL